LKELVTLILTKYTELTEEQTECFYASGAWTFTANRTLRGKNPVIVEMTYGDKSIWLEHDRTLDKYAHLVF
jgi:hypothetical protein